MRAVYRISVLVFALMLPLGAPSAFAKGRTSVRTYHKKNGTVVQRHQRSGPDKTQRNNWSSKGNTNPNTGKRGSKPVTH